MITRKFRLNLLCGRYMIIEAGKTLTWEMLDERDLVGKGETERNHGLSPEVDIANKFGNIWPVTEVN